MNLEFDSDQRDVAELARSVGSEVLSIAARAAESNGCVPEDVWKTVFDTGLTVPVPDDLGGAGIGDAATVVVALENLAYGDPGITLATFASGAAALLVARHGGLEHAETARRLTTDPRARAAIALYEPHGRGAAEFATTISETGGGMVRVQGRKVAVAYPRLADPLVVVGADAATGSPRAVIITPDTCGVAVEPYAGTLALGAMDSGTVTFDAAVPTANMLGSPEDTETLLDTIGLIRLAVAAIAIGTAQRAVEYAANYATERIAFGKPIAAFQGVAFPLAEATMRIDASRLEIAEAAAELDTGDPAAATDRVASVSRAVAYACEVAAEATRTSVQTVGGHGFIAEHPVELWYRSAAALSTLDFDPLCSSFEPAL
jgi:alkylation response protein AidB-like acyl-CoA dehydrogenase